MSSMVIGVDVGNSDTKSDNTSTYSGYKVYDVCPTMANEYMLYNGKYYAPTSSRFNYIPDKSVNENMFILTLIAIAKEILYRKDKAHAKGQESASRKNISKEVITVHLGVGVPPAHHAKLSKKYAEYYKERFKNQIDFTYDNVDFHILVKTVRVFTQDYSVVMVFGAKSKYISQGFKRFAAVDIGGTTVDSVVVNDKVAEKFKSVESGIISMYNEIEAQINTDYGVNLDHQACESILLDEPTIVKPEIKAKVKEITEDWTERIIGTLRADLDFEAYPTIFIGGGSRMLKSYLVKNKTLKNFEFLGNPNANAQAYSRLLKGLLAAKG